MDLTSIIIIAILVVLFLVSLIWGILNIFKYIKTKNKRFLVLGIIFTFIIPAIILLFLIPILISSTMVVYGPAPPNTGIEYGPAPPDGTIVYGPAPPK